MASEKNQSFVVENGVTIGVIVLALFVIFGVGLPRWVGGDAAHSAVAQSPITLPDKVGKYLPAADQNTWSQGVKDKVLSQDNATSIEQQASQMEAQAKKNAKTLGSQAATKMYVDVKDQAFLVVAAIRSRNAFLQGITANLQKVGNSVCQTATDSSGGSAIDCSRTSDDLTIEVQAQGGNQSADSVAKYVDQIWDQVA